MAYQAFISYSHAADDALAPALQHGLQTLARPWNRRRALEVFRDQTGLAVSPGLWSSIQSALDESEHFVLLASPEAAASPWVDREIEYWLGSHSLDRLLPVVTGGEWVWDPTRGDFDARRSTAVPPSLMGLFTEEPRHLDLRWARSEGELDLRNSKFRDAVAQLAAPMHSTTPEDLESADVTHYRHVVRLRRAVVAVLSIMLVLVSVAGVVAVRNLQESRRQQTLAEVNAHEAEQQAQRALALQLMAQAESIGEEQRSLSLLLSLEATRLDPAESWGSLVDVMAAVPGLDKIIDLPSGVHASNPSAIDPLGKYVATATNQGDIRLWDLMARSGTRRVLKRPIELYPKAPDELVFSQTSLLAARYVCPPRVPCGRTRVPKIAVWDIDKRQSRTLPGSVDFGSPVFDQAGETLAALSASGQVRLWDVDSASVRETLDLPKAAHADAVALSADGTTVAVGDGAGAILLFRLDGSPRRTQLTIQLPAGQRPAQLLFASRGALVCRSDTGQVTIWDVRSGRQQQMLQHIGRTRDIAVGPDAALTTAGEDGLLRLWDLETLRQVGSGRTWGPRAGSGVDVVFTEPGQITSVSSDIRVWDGNDWGKTGTTLYSGPVAVTALAMGASGELVSADARGVVTLADHLDGDGLERIDTGQEPVSSLAVSDLGVLATGGEDGTVRLWDAVTRRPLGTLPARPDRGVTTLAFNEGGDLLAVGYGKGPGQQSATSQPIWIWDVSQRKVAIDLPAGLAADVQAVAFGANEFFASAGSDYLTVRDLASDLSTVLVQDPGGRFSALAFSPDGTSLAASGFRPGQDKSRPVGVWDPTRSKDQPAVNLDSGPSPGWDGTFDALAFAPNGHLLAGAGTAGLQLWDIDSLQRIGGLLTSSVSTSVVVSPDGHQIVVGNKDGRVETYPATLAGWRTLACATLSRNLTAPEWKEFVGATTPYRKACPQYPGG